MFPGKPLEIADTIEDADSLDSSDADVCVTVTCDTVVVLVKVITCDEVTCTVIRDVLS